MGNVLVYLQHNNGKLPKSTAIGITAAKDLKKNWNKGKIIGVALGTGASLVADDGLEYGLDEVYFSENPIFEKYLSMPYAAAIKDCFSKSGADTLIGTSTSSVKDCFPRVSAMIDAGQASDITAVNSDGTLVRPMYAGDLFAQVELLTSNKVISVRGTAFSAAVKSGKVGTKTELTGSWSFPNAGEVVGYETSKSERPELSDAEIVVSGGRALGSSENFQKVIFPLADAFGAAVGASRAAVDSGYAPNDWQVGQTGKIVAPSLYLAVGISGAIQHLAGMKDSKVIVAINKDPDAPIFEIADYGLVADLFEVAPVLTEAVKKIKAG